MTYETKKVLKVRKSKLLESPTAYSALGSRMEGE
jgi:hypothetical protein